MRNETPVRKGDLCWLDLKNQPSEIVLVLRVPSRPTDHRKDAWVRVLRPNGRTVHVLLPWLRTVQRVG